MTQEITIPLDLKRVVLMGAEETKLGDKKGALKQYRKGTLHIREYEDRLTVHADKVDPREDPMGHLIQDAQEVLVGLAGAAVSGAAIGSYIYKIKKNSPYRNANYCLLFSKWGIFFHFVNVRANCCTRYGSTCQSN